MPVLDGVEELLRGEDAVSGGSRRNRAYADGFTTWADDVPAWRRRLACDATTSGGLLAAVPPEGAAAAAGPVIGRLVEGDPGAVLVR